MTLREVIDVIHKVPRGFMVAFDVCDGRYVHCGYFPYDPPSNMPGRIEPLIPCEEIAWAWARLFAEYAPPEVRNIYVVNHQYKPVPGYDKKRLRRGFQRLKKGVR